MNDDIFFNFKVNCIDFPGQECNMQVRFCKTENNTYVNIPCQGCDFCHNSQACIKCISAINEFFFKNPEERPNYFDPDKYLK